MLLEINSYDGIGPIRFGMTVDEVRSVMPSNFRSFMKSRTSKFPADHFMEIGVHVHYRPPGQCEAVEVFKPSDAIFLERRFMGQSFLEIYEWAKTIDPKLDTDDCGFTSFLHGFGIFASGASKAPLDPVEGIIAFQKGYYD
jgi:hypothetical protein